MPRSAVAGDHPEFVLPVGEIGALLSKLARDGLPHGGGSRPMRDPLDVEIHWAHPELAGPPPTDPPLGTPSGFTCPECHGALWEIDDAAFPRYRCRVGHGFSVDSLLSTQRSDVEMALWTAYRALEERAALCRRLAERARLRHAAITAEHFRADAGEIARQAEILGALLWSRDPGGRPERAESAPTEADGRTAEEPGT
jgi:two-component system, chemotaxis family, protein-glutamate methylesterase/glutaminase